jgi:hypothetical protein
MGSWVGTYPVLDSTRDSYVATQGKKKRDSSEWELIFTMILILFTTISRQYHEGLGIHLASGESLNPIVKIA